jgi:hypothetical protein
MPIRVNPRALEAATRKALEAGPLQRRWELLSDAERRGCLAQAETLLRAYADAKDADLAARRADPQQTLLPDEDS